MEHDDMEKMDEDIANAFDPEQNAALIAMIEDENQTPTGSIRITIDWIAD
jgi:hypothetical protein